MRRAFDLEGSVDAELFNDGRQVILDTVYGRLTLLTAFSGIDRFRFRGNRLCWLSRRFGRDRRRLSLGSVPAECGADFAGAACSSAISSNGLQRHVNHGVAPAIPSQPLRGAVTTLVTTWSRLVFSAASPAAIAASSVFPV